MSYLSQKFEKLCGTQQGHRSHYKKLWSFNNDIFICIIFFLMATKWLGNKYVLSCLDSTTLINRTVSSFSWPRNDERKFAVTARAL